MHLFVLNRFSIPLNFFYQHISHRTNTMLRNVACVWRVISICTAKKNTSILECPCCSCFEHQEAWNLHFFFFCFSSSGTLELHETHSHCFTPDLFGSVWTPKTRIYRKVFFTIIWLRKRGYHHCPYDLAWGFVSDRAGVLKGSRDPRGS